MASKPPRSNCASGSVAVPGVELASAPSGSTASPCWARSIMSRASKASAISAGVAFQVSAGVQPNQPVPIR
ncbi:MAG: hypothetical protein HZT43_11895 [Exiguobacterium profundum]|nr:MAG: hypothetical protein HZT43_11895 [Exiguobacterium profundum]